MSKDLLSEATRALRDSEQASEFEARATRTRVLSGLHQTRVRRRTRLAFLLPIAASFVAVSAWGAASGQARIVLERIERFVGVTAKSPSGARVPAPRRLTAPAILSGSSPEPAEPPPRREAEPLPPPPKALPVASSTRATSSASASPERAERADPTLALYRVAHAAHFVDHDPARALAAWDAYLGAAPNGAFAPEARYNRALSLVRLGRSQEARRALEPFANGAYGGYRKAEASALLERIER
jgi:TolA-binding protein